MAAFPPPVISPAKPRIIDNGSLGPGQLGALPPRIRRKFDAALKERPVILAWILKRITALYRIERLPSMRAGELDAPPEKIRALA